MLSRFTSPLGPIILSSDGESLTGLWFEDQATGPAACAEGDSPALAEARRWLEGYFSGKIPDFTPPLRLDGTPFRRAVWDILLTIPYGRTLTYGDVADIFCARFGRERMSAQAVGDALHHNPISLIVPCHRVVGAGGKLTGYGGGLWRKEWLLTFEGNPRQRSTMT